MCQILFAVGQHPQYPLVLAANRDEFYARPTADAAYWSDAPQLLAGRDLRAGGTWLGVTREGRWAAVTNFRKGKPGPGLRSRGELVTDYLLGQTSPAAYLENLRARRDEYAGFNLLLGLGAEVWQMSNHSHEFGQLPPGVHGLSNGALNNDWPKVIEGRTRLAQALQGQHPDWDAIRQVLADRTPAPRSQLPDTGLGEVREHALSSQFIVTPDYGTRCTTLLHLSATGEWRFEERRFGPEGVPQGHSAFQWRSGDANLS